MSLLGTLDNDTVLQILSILQKTHPQSLTQLRLTSHKLYVLAQRFLYRTLSLTFVRRRHQRIQRLLNHVSSDESLIASVREIHIFLLPSELLHSGDEGQHCLDILIDLIPRLAGLKRLIYQVELSFDMSTLSPEESAWDHRSGILPLLLHTLHQYHPNCRLDISLPYRLDLMSILALLAHSPCLKSLIINVHDQQMLAFKSLLRVVSTCPNLRRLSILSRTSFDPAYTTHELRSQRNCPLQLETLEVDGPLVLLKKGLDHPSPDFVDWSTLRELTLINPLNITVLTYKHISLRILRIRLDTVPGFSNVEEVRPLLRSLLANQRLEVLEAGGSSAVPHAITPEMLEPLGTTLRCLKIHGNEDMAGLCKRFAYSLADLEQLGETLKTLHTFGLDINFDGQWPLDTLSAIASRFPSLVHLELYFEMNIAQPQQPLQPAVTLSSVRDIWIHIWKAMVAARLGRPDLVACPRLSALDINVGSFRVSHKFGDFEDWELREQIRFRVRRSVRDDEAKAGLATISCVELDDLALKRGTGPVTNEYQERLMQEVRERASYGLAWKRDPRLDRQGSNRIENNFRELLAFQNARLLLDEEQELEWASGSTEN